MGLGPAGVGNNMGVLQETEKRDGGEYDDA